MFTAVAPILILFTAAAVYVHADPNPINPGPGDVFIQGEPCVVSWDVDSTGLWKTMNIDLMTGNNFDMVSLARVGTADGTDPAKNTFSYTCPKVTPYSPIYFYQFTTPSTSNKTWTGRFTITDSTNDVVAPSQSTQPDGEKIPWGTGALVNGSSSTTTSTVSVVSSNAGRTPTDLPPSSTTLASSATPSNTSTSSTMPLAPTPSDVHSTVGENGAMATLSVSSILFRTGLALALAAVGFTVAS